MRLRNIFRVLPFLLLGSCSLLADQDKKIDNDDWSVTVTGRTGTTGIIHFDFTVTNHSNRRIDFYQFDIVVTAGGQTFRSTTSGIGIEPGEAEASFHNINVGTNTYSGYTIDNKYAVDYAEDSGW